MIPSEESTEFHTKNIIGKREKYSRRPKPAEVFSGTLL